MNIFPWQKPLWVALHQRRERLAHGLLFRGPRGVGKREFALALGAALLCRSAAADGQGCGRCSSCHWFKSGNHPDFRLIQPEAATPTDPDGESAASGRKPSKLIRIEQARDLADWLAIGSHQGGYRVAVIQPAEAMNNATANALLKTLEEPPAGTVLILVSHESDRLLPTIRSRCQSLDFPLPSHDAALRWLEAQGMPDAEIVLRLVGGAPLAARERGAMLDTSQTLAQALSDPGFDPLLLAGQLQSNSMADVIDLLQRWTIDLAQAAAGLPVRYFPLKPADIDRAGRGLNLAGLVGFYRRLVAARSVAEHPLAPRLVLEELFVEYAHLRRNYA